MFREFQNQINRISRRLAEVQNKLAVLMNDRDEERRNPTGLRGSRIHAEIMAEYENVISSLLDEEVVLNNELRDVRIQMQAAIAIPLAA